MFFLLSAIVCSSMISIFMRLSTGHISAKISMLAMNYLTCMVMAVIYTGANQLLPRTDGIGLTLGLGLVNGLFYMLALVLTQYNIKKNGVVLSSVFAKLGALLVPLVVSISVFSEVPEVTQAAGALLAVAAMIVMNYEKGKMAAGSGLLLLFLFFTEGAAAAMSKIYGEIGRNSLSEHFLLYTFTAAFLLCLILILYRKEKPGLSEGIFGILIGLANFSASRFLLKALEEVPAVIAYPFRGVAVIALVSLAGIFLFKERLKKRQWAAIGVILAAVVLLNL